VSVDEDGDTAGVYGQRYASGTPQGGAFRVNTITTGYQSYIDVAADGSGNFVVVWATGNGSPNLNVWGRRFAASGAALDVPFLVNTYTTGEQARPAVGRTAAGDFVVVWQSSGQLPGGSDVGIYGQRYSSTGAPLGTEFQINTLATGASSPDVSMDSGGKFVVAWQAAPGGSYLDVFARRYSASGVPLAPEFVVNTLTSGSQFYPIVSAQSSVTDTVGSFVVAWTVASLYGGQPGVFARRFVGNGPPLGGEFRVNTFTEGTPSLGGLDHDGLGNFVIAWTQGPPAQSDVYLRRYCRALAGDVDATNAIDVNDVFYLINYLFAHGPALAHSGDANGDSVVDVNDVFYLINYLYAGGPPPSCPVSFE